MWRGQEPRNGSLRGKKKKGFKGEGWEENQNPCDVPMEEEFCGMKCTGETGYKEMDRGGSTKSKHI